ncbi:hypothetical protein PAAG_07703 [Paracoccidioides lutzii Pb01]|uniref:ADP-ribosylation factor n=1 Tax=Paracoccidioides lutzii (strain ATCC MYA-826 / Pb01) TaxID=502779 RepID=C1H9X4_PARBA|nr:hypothetical protein PAAG_07703 [Paracoccidioides lutzii Pb01]EEH37147.2 hypothetical protein PAAG_07703 [Paracoccidioides lutzii Pb01]
MAARGDTQNKDSNNDNSSASRTDDNGAARELTATYYSSFPNRSNLRNAFRNLDNPIHFAECRGCLVDEATRNFVVDFGNDEAGPNRSRRDGYRFYMNLDIADWTYHSNIWSPELQREVAQTVTSDYGVSARLQAMMVSEPDTSPSNPADTVNRPPISKTEPDLERKSMRSSPEDLERGHQLAGLQRAETAISSLDGTGFSKISLAQVVNKIWHFASVDYGQKYLCLGYNSLHVASGVHFGTSPGKPDGKRVWTWLLICDDGTVISIHENPFPRPSEMPQKQRQKALEVIRRNTNLVFSGISSQHIASEHSNPLMTTYVRNFPNETGTAAVKPGEGPSLLFYYLFDNWPANYNLVVGREHSYNAALDSLRKRMLERAEVGLIDELHTLGRQLAVLQRLYQSYDLIVNRILKRQRLLREEVRISQSGPGLHDHHHHQSQQNHGGSPFGLDFLNRANTSRSMAFDETNPTDLGGVQLSSAAIGRFERLLDRIRLYALSEIDGCLTEKESMTFMVFNLIAVKDSQAVERLTRTTILIAKATVLFLPVTLMTGYFSTQIKELEGVYTVKQYWVSFAVLLALSAIVLAVYGWATDTVEGKTIYVSFAKSFYRSSAAALGRKKHKVK